MSSSKKTMKALWPFMPDFTDWGKSPREDWEAFKTNVDTVWDQYEEMQKAAKEAWTEHWNTFFNQCIELEKTVASVLPDEKVSVPGMPEAMSPKEVAEKAVEFQEKANAHAVEQNDKAFDFAMKGQKQIREVVTDTVKTVEENLEKKAEEPKAEPKEEKKAEKAAPVKEEKAPAAKAPKAAPKAPKTAAAKAPKAPKTTRAPKAAKVTKEVKEPNAETEPKA